MSVASEAMSALQSLQLPKGFKPAWELVGLLPGQGEWTEGEYLWLTDRLDSDRRVELVNGRIEVLPVPTPAHQLINGFLYRVLFTFVEAHALGIVVFPGLRVRLPDTNFRQPDVVYMSCVHARQCNDKFWEGADLAMEVVSEDDPDRDYVEKRREYAKAGISEYWIVDPRDRSVTLLGLKDKRYQKRGTYRDGDTVSSSLLPGFTVAVTEIFDAAKLPWHGTT